MNSSFIENCSKFGVFPTNDELEKFERLYRRLVEENEKYNLTAITEKEKVYTLHFLDSLSANPFIKKNSSLCDVGSGGGFPALPIKITRPDVSVTMTDSVNKKVVFLNETAKALSLSDCVAIHTRVEEFSRSKSRESFDIVTSRAVARHNTLCEYCLPLVKIGGIFIAYKSDCEYELFEAKKAIEILGGKLLSIQSFDINGEYKRSLVIIEKIKETPKNYPRGKNKERTSPII